MKESNFYSDDFEQLIREKTEQYKMYPSENVWKGVHNSLHTKRKWFIGSMAAMVIGILFFSGRELIAPSGHPSSRRMAAGPVADASSADGTGTELSRTNTTEPDNAPHTGLRPGNLLAAVLRHDPPSGDAEQEGPDQSYKGLTISISNPVISQPDLSALLSHVPGSTPALNVIAARGMNAETVAARLAEEEGSREPGLLDSWLVRNAPGSPAAASRKGVDGATAARSNTEGTGSRESVDDAAARNVLESLSARGQQRLHNSIAGSSLAGTKAGQQQALRGDDALSDSARTFTAASAAAIGEAADRSRINWLHDYAVYSLPVSPQRDRFLFQFTLAPTVNYRSLNGGNYMPSKSLQNSTVTLNHPGNAQNYADHSPSLGFQFGGSLLYKVTRNLAVKGGLQFNFSRYQVRAYTAKPQQSATTLNSYYGYYVDSITAMTSSGSFAGEPVQTVSNDYYQLSAPIGFELRVLGNERLQFNIGATIQPSYLLNTNAYMLTPDYTNYAKQPSSFKRWNVNGAVEAFLSYQTGPIRWQVGPEFRYQLMSTYSSQYPIGENLRGYGLKFGITKMLP